MKNIKSLQLFMLLSFVILSLVACGDHEEDIQQPVSTSSLIEGIWKHEFSSGASFYVFNNNGIGYYIEFDYKDGFTPGGIEEVSPFKYVYNEEDEILVTIEDERRYEHYVHELTSKKLVWIDPDGYVDTYTRYNGDLNDIEREYDVTLKVDWD